MQTTMECYLILVRMGIIKAPKITNVGKDVKKGNPCPLLVGCKLKQPVWKQYGSSQNFQNITTIEFSHAPKIYLSCLLPRENLGSELFLSTLNSANKSVKEFSKH